VCDLFSLCPKSFSEHAGLLYPSVRRGVAGYRGGSDGMAWEATAGNWRRRRAAALGFGGLLVVRFAAGAAEAVGEKPLERVLPLDRK